MIQNPVKEYTVIYGLCNEHPPTLPLETVRDTWDSTPDPSPTHFGSRPNCRQGHKTKDAFSVVGGRVGAGVTFVTSQRDHYVGVSHRSTTRAPTASLSNVLSTRGPLPPGTATINRYRKETLQSD